jgi:integrase
MASFRKRGDHWFYRFVDAEGIMRERRGSQYLEATKRMAGSAETEARLIESGSLDPRDVAYRDHEARPIGAHLDDWQTVLLSKGDSAKHVGGTIGQARRLLERAGITRLSGLSADRLQEALASMRAEGASLSTLNSYRTSARAFGAWLARSGRLRSNPMAALSGYNASEDPRHERRTLGLDELRLLIDAAHRGEPYQRMPGPARALVYRLATSSGLRFSELASLRPASFDLEACPPLVTCGAGYTKNGQTATLALPTDLADDLRSYLAGRPADGPAFDLPAKGAKMLRVDLVAAGLPYRDDAGRVFDFHSLRCQFATVLDQTGASPRTTQRLMRHSTLDLTNRYTRPRSVDLHSAVESIPSTRPSSPDSEAQAKTGTYGDTFANPLPIGAREEGRLGTHADVMGALSGQSGPEPKPLETKAPDTAGRSETHCAANAPRWTRTINPLIKSQLLCQLS